LNTGRELAGEADPARAGTSLPSLRTRIAEARSTTKASKGGSKQALHQSPEQRLRAAG